MMFSELMDRLDAARTIREKRRILLELDLDSLTPQEKEEVAPIMRVVFVESDPEQEPEDDEP